MVGADPSHKPPFWGRRTSGTGWAGDREGQEPREKGLGGRGYGPGNHGNQGT